MATVKEIIDAFCYRINVPAYSAYVGQTAPAQAQYYSLFEFVGDNLRNRPFNWPQLKRGYTMTTTSGVARIELPGDFYKLLESTQWDVTNKWPLRGPISDFNMAVRQFSVVSLQTRKAYRIIGAGQYLYNANQRSAGSMEIDPAPTNSTDQLYMQYLSRNWVWPVDWVTSTVYSAGAIVTGIGQVYKTAAGGTSGATRPSHTTGTVTDGAVLWTVYTEPYVATTDNDLVLFDKDLMVEGMRWAYLRAKGLDFNQERQDWEGMVRAGYSRFQGATRINASDEMGEGADWPIIPPGSWSV